MAIKRHLASSYRPAQAVKLLIKRECRRERQREKRIEDIVAAAVELFSKEGASGFSMRRVAKRARVNLSTLQHYFEKGENLFKVTITSITSHYIDMLRAIDLDGCPTPEARFHMLTDEIISWSTDPVISDCYFELYALASKDADVARLLQEVYMAYYEVLTDFVRELNPALSRERAAMIALMIGAHIDGVMIVRYRAAPALPDGDGHIIAAMKEEWLRAIFSPPASDGQSPRGLKSLPSDPARIAKVTPDSSQSRVAPRTQSKRRHTTHSAR